MRAEAENRKWRLVLAAVLLCVLTSSVETALAQEEIQSPAILQSLSMGPVEKGRVQVTLVVDVLAAGQATLELDLPKELEIVVQPKATSFATPGRVEATWTVAVPEEGEYFVQALLRVAQDASKARPEYASFQTFALYVELSGNALQWQGNAPDPKSLEPMQDVERPNLQKSDAMPILDLAPGEMRVFEKPIGKGSAVTYDIYVYVAGNIRYPNGTGTCMGNGYSGVPNSRVYLDWDYDHDPTTGYTPYFASNIRHAGYDDTLMDGSYYFWFHFTSNVPASAYSDRIRVYASRYNGHAENVDSPGGYFPSYYYINIAQAVDWINDAAAHVNVWAPDGGALRYLYRARLFCQAELGWSTSQLNRYYIREGHPISFYCHSGNNCGSGTPGPGFPYILFNRLPDADLAYHEQGHFVDGHNQYMVPTGGGSHYFQLPTIQRTAWVEGWAEFYDAAGQLYWAGVEQPPYVEYSTYYRSEYQFLEQTQATLPTGVDRKTVEGAIASFAFNLYDKVSPRHPGYFGDNDNLGATGGTILSAWNGAEFDSCNIVTGLCNNMIVAFNTRMKNAMGSKWTSSVQAMYDYFLNASGAPRSATPSTLSVTGSDHARNLTWNDTTSPASVPYTCYTISPQRNNESGFRIYRKAGGGAWDGTLTGYSLVGTVGANVTSTTHTLDDRLAQSYVVVAHNGSGESVPVAQAVWPEAPLPAISGPTGIPSGVAKNWTGSASGGTSPYTFRWYTGPYSCQGTWTLRSTASNLAVSSTSDFCIKLEVQGGNGSTGTATLPVDVGYIDCGPACFNLAPGKYVASSGLWDAENSPAEKLNDGNTGTTSVCQGPDGYCAIASDPGHAQAIGNFFQIDLGGIKSVNSVTVYGRRDTAFTQGQDLKLRLSRDGLSWFDYFMEDTTSPDGFTVPTGRLARYVKVETTTVVYLSLYEVKVMGPSTCGNGICEPGDGEWCDSCPYDCAFTTLDLSQNECVMCDTTGEIRCGPGMSLWCCY
jgi:F5/8 type C domain-containing protein